MVLMSRLLSRLLVALPVLAMALMIGGPTPRAEAAGGGIAVAQEDDYYPITGVDTTRDDVSISGIPWTNCFPVPATDQWNDDGMVLQRERVQGGSYKNYVAFGTSHQCGDTIRFWYWGYAQNNIWHLVSWREVGPGPTHRFFVFRDPNTWWYANIDTTLVGTFTYNLMGKLAQVDLWSNTPATVPAYGNYALGYSEGYQPYQYWDGQDFASHSGNTCHRWLSNNAIIFGQNVGC